MPGRAYNRLLERAHDQHGFLIPDDARALGLDPALLRTLHHRGWADRTAWGLYRMRAVPAGPLDQYMAATLWPRGRGVLSHETALDLHDLCDVNPAKIHLTIPSGYRLRRKGPPAFSVHWRDLPEGDITHHEGIRIVTPRRAILDAIEAHLGGDLIDQAIDTARRRGLTTPDELEQIDGVRGRRDTSGTIHEPTTP